jgi:UDP-N-acetylmuramate dehydrogenase
MKYDLPQVSGEYRFDFPLAKTTWFGVGGNADIFYKPKDVKDLSDFLKNKPLNLDITILGVCSNLIIRDGGIKGCVIKLGRNFSYINHKENIITAGCGTLDIHLAKYAAENELSGLEFFIGIPGTIGGALAMNAGAYGKEVKDCLVSAKAIDNKGNLIELKNSDFNFSYRKNDLPKDLIFVEASFICQRDNKDKIIEKMNFISQSRESSQPVRSKTGGSTFKNPDETISKGKKAWQLIDEAGLRGYIHGGAQFSEKHCNFLINIGDARANDLEELGELIRKRVYDNTGITLNWEIKIIGSKLNN